LDPVTETPGTHEKSRPEEAARLLGGDADDPSELVYAELRRLAAAFLRRERAGHTLQPTALVHEAWAKLARLSASHWQSRAHFLAVAARAMRRVLVNHALARQSLKRGGDRRQVTLDAPLRSPGGGVDTLELHDAIERLADLDARKARLVEMRFFAGMSVEEVATVLGVSRSTVEADWRFARAWLSRELSP